MYSVAVTKRKDTKAAAVRLHWAWDSGARFAETSVELTRGEGARECYSQRTSNTRVSRFMPFR
jgi:hypothetical protein